METDNGDFCDFRIWLRDFYVVRDRSLSLGKVFRLLRRGNITVPWILSQAYSRRRQLRVTPPVDLSIDVEVTDNKTLLAALRSQKDLSAVLAFRAGLILDSGVLKSYRCFNIHCARLPTFAGLGAIRRALSERQYSQMACVHTMVEKIDAGETLLSEPYELQESLPYWQNELNAYLAGARALDRFLETKGLHKK